MKTFKILFALAIVSLLGCDDGYIDDINAVDPGPDQEEPTITFNYPIEGTAVRVVEEVTSITISFRVSDDIELQSATVQLDGEQIGTYEEFVDYRTLIVTDLVYESLTNGNHTLTIQATDLAGKTASQSVSFEKVEPYEPMENEIFYMGFDGEYVDLVTLTAATQVGSPSINTDEAVAGIGSYQGAEGAYLTFPTSELTNSEFSASFWMKVNNVPDRAGILVMGPEMEGAAADAQNNRSSGFRFFRESAGDDQRFKLNVGNGVADTWFDGGDDADVTPAGLGEWHHFAFTITQSSATVYIDGEIVSTNTFAGVAWNGCDVLSIMSGAPRFTQWGHYSDESILDELRIFDTELTQEEVQAIMEAEMPG